MQNKEKIRFSLYPYLAMTTFSLQRSLLTVTKVAFLEKYNCNQIFLIVISPFNLIQIPVQDLTKESFHELDRRLSVDKVGLETVFRYFCVEVGYIPPITRLCFSYEYRVLPTLLLTQ